MSISASVRWQGLAVAALMVLVAGCGGSGGSSYGGGGGGSSSSSSSSSASSSSSSSSSAAVADVPELALTIDGGAAIADKDTYVTGTIAIAATDTSPAFSGAMSVKLHGNSTLMFDKKAYRIKLADKAALLGMPKDKNWILLANYSDKTLLRNRTAFELSRRLGMAWTPRAFPVEVTLNGQYVGVYDLVEQVRVAKDRVNLTATDDSTAPADGGYLIEMDQHFDEAVCWHTGKAIPYCLKDPDPGTADQDAYIENYVQAAEDALFSADPTNPATGYESYIDVDSLINWYIVEELFKNVDSADYSSNYLYKDKGGKLSYGPVWDFDLGAGNTDYFDATPHGFQTATGVWIARMKAADPTFETRIRARWNAVKGSQIDTLPDWINQQAALMDTAEKRNFIKWPILNTYVWPNSEVAGSYDGEVKFFHDWMVQRIAWLDANL